MAFIKSVDVQNKQRFMQHTLLDELTSIHHFCNIHFITTIATTAKKKKNRKTKTKNKKQKMNHKNSSIFNTFKSFLKRNIETTKT